MLSLAVAGSGIVEIKSYEPRQGEQQHPVRIESRKAMQHGRTLGAALISSWVH
jgi:hypothetical protein